MKMHINEGVPFVSRNRTPIFLFLRRWLSCFRLSCFGLLQPQKATNELAVLLLFMVTGAVAAGPAVGADAVSVAPAAEQAKALQEGVDGPTENRGIGGVKALGMVALGHDFPALEGRVMRAREITLLPGGVVAVHKHDQRPGVAYILEGEVYEHRGSAPPELKRQGEVAFEQSGVTHWWENRTEGVVRAFVVDIVPAPKEGGAE